MATLQVKGMDDALYAALSARAERDGRSISQEVATVIKDFLGRPAGSCRESTREFLELAGSWADERPAEKIVHDLRESRRNRKRSRDGRDVFA